jgi:PA14 domain
MKKLMSEPKKYYENKETIVKEHSKEARQKINGFYQRREINKMTQCDGMFLYEEMSDGDGITAKYYDNESWQGSYIQRVDENIDFLWTGTSPDKNINKYNFSVKWVGYLMAPYTDRFTFSLECDDACSFSLNGDLLISQDMETAVTENSGRTETWMKTTIHKRKTPGKNKLKSDSEEVQLIGGNLYL